MSLAPLLVLLVGAAPPDAGGTSGADVGRIDSSPPTVETRIEPAEVVVGERIRFEILLSHDGSKVFRMPEGLDLGVFEVVERQALATGPPGPDGRVAERLVLVLALFEPGEHRLPDLELPYVDPSGQEFRVHAPGGVVRCRSVLANVSQVELKPPSGPVPVIVEDRTLLYVAGALGLVLITALVAFVVARLLQRRERQEPPVPQIPPEVIARGRLQTLRAEDLPGRGLVKEFFLELSHILREYFGNRFRIGALEMTSEELLGYIDDDDLRRTVEPFLDGSDLVKFAKARPDAEESEAYLKTAELIVDVTTPRAEPAPAPGEGDAA